MLQEKVAYQQVRRLLWFSLKGEEILISREKESLLLNAKTLVPVRIFENSFLTDFLKVDEEYYYLLEHNYTLLDKNLKCVFNESGSARFLNSPYGLLYWHKTEKQQLFNFRTKVKSDLKSPNRYYLADNDNLYGEEYGRTKASTVHCYSLSDGQWIWSYGFHDLGLVETITGVMYGVHLTKFIGAHDQKLYLGLTGKQLIILDTTSGKELAHLTHIDSYLTFLDTDSGLVFGLNKDEYWQIDPITFELTRKPMKAHFEQTGFARDGATIYALAFDAHYLYCLSDPMFNGQMAIIDRQTLELVWLHSFAEQWQAVPLEIYADSRWVYILDTAATLHILEKPTQL